MNALVLLRSAREVLVVPARATIAAVVDRVARNRRQSTAAALRELRMAFPHSPLSLRLAAAETLRRRRSYIPR
jgi:hypothetical protein